MTLPYDEYFQNLKQHVSTTLDRTQLYQFKGTVSKLLGLTVEVKLPGLKIGDLCYIETYNGEKKPAEVVAFKGETAQLLLLMVYRKSNYYSCWRFSIGSFNKPYGRTN